MAETRITSEDRASLSDAELLDALSIAGSSTVERLAHSYAWPHATPQSVRAAIAVELPASVVARIIAVRCAKEPAHV